MTKAIKTYLLCFDDHRAFSEDIKKRFSDETRYTVLSFQTTEDFINHLVEEKKYKFCRVAILGLHESKENFEMVDNLTMKIKNIDPRTNIILLGPEDKIEDIKKSVIFNIDSYIPKNANLILRIHNAVKKLQSAYSLINFRRSRNFSFYVLLIFILISILIAIVAYFKLPEYF